MSGHHTTPTGSGLIVQPTYGLSGDLFYAEVEPAGSRWLPWPGRMSRWWYEVNSVGETDDQGVSGTTYAYLDGGSGGALAFATCVRRAQEAVADFAGASHV